MQFTMYTRFIPTLDRLGADGGLCRKPRLFLR